MRNASSNLAGGISNWNTVMKDHYIKSTDRSDPEFVGYMRCEDKGGPLLVTQEEGIQHIQWIKENDPGKYSRWIFEVRPVKEIQDVLDRFTERNT